MNLLLHLLILLPLAAASSSSSTRFLEAASSYFPDLDDDDKLAYTNWLNDHTSSYTRETFLPTATDPNTGVATFWNIDGDSINFAIAVQADGWVGFGISEAGGMLGSDVAMFQASTSELVDSYILTERAAPFPDDCQDWKLISSTTENGWIIIEMNRKLDTGDSQDHAIKNDEDLWNAPTRLIAAWGDDEDVLYHGNKKAKSSVRLFGDRTKGLTEVLVEESDGSFEVIEDNFEIPARETTYHDNCKTFDELKDQLDLSEGNSMVTMIGVAPVIDEETREFVHHFIVYLQEDCSSSSFQRSQIYGWAPGAEGLLYPNDVGFPIFHDENHQAVAVEIHYNNPSKIENMRDSSGVKFYYTKTKRLYDAGVLQLGDPLVTLEDEPINDGETSYQFTCPGSCTSSVLGLGNRKVTVIQELLHMHKTGVRMTNEIIRGDEIAHKALVDIYDFDQQGTFQPNQEPYELMSGDSFRTTCYYKDGSKFGLGSQEEMCIAFLTYYPAITIQPFNLPWVCPYVGSFDLFGCSQELENADLSSEDELGRNFGTPAGECAAEPTTTPPTAGPATAPSAATQTTAPPTAGTTTTPSAATQTTAPPTAGTTTTPSAAAQTTAPPTAGTTTTPSAAAQTTAPPTAGTTTTPSAAAQTTAPPTAGTTTTPSAAAQTTAPPTAGTTTTPSATAQTTAPPTAGTTTTPSAAAQTTAPPTAGTTTTPSAAAQTTAPPTAGTTSTPSATAQTTAPPTAGTTTTPSAAAQTTAPPTAGTTTTPSAAAQTTAPPTAGTTSTPSATAQTTAPPTAGTTTTPSAATQTTTTITLLSLMGMCCLCLLLL